MEPIYLQYDVIKRNGNKEKFNTEKIMAYINLSTNGLDGVDGNELFKDLIPQLKNEMKTSDIQKTLTVTASEKIDIDRPNWTFVASRLFLFDLYHIVSTTGRYYDIKEYITRYVDEGKLHSALLNGFDFDKINKAIDPSRDFLFNYLGIKTLHDRYLLKNSKGKVIELPQHMFMCIAMFLASKEKEENKTDWAIKFYNVLSKFEAMVATPTLANARTVRNQLSSCYVGSIDDSLEGIMDSYKNMSIISKLGGGIGYDVSHIRSLGSSIDGYEGKAGGLIPFMKIANDVAVAFDQLGVRKGAIAVYLEIWHKDVMEFLELRKNSGEERRRAHDLFTALWINDLFMERVKNDEDWSLFDPHDVRDLLECHGEKFKNKYIQYENNPNVNKVTLKAKNIWKEILRQYFETGMPFLCFKDTANRINPNPHRGIIRSSNLCSEIFQNTKPTSYGDHEIDINDNITFKSKRSYNNGEIAVCNLASINIAKTNTEDDIKRVVPIVIRMLDNVIDLNLYPVIESAQTNQDYRSIGCGILGEAEYMASKQIMYGSKDHYNEINKIMSMISYNVINTSADLAQEKGSYKWFKDSNWNLGKLPMDYAKKEVLELTDELPKEEMDRWNTLRDKVKLGMRNGYLMSIAPTSSISILMGTTASIEACYKKKWYEENLTGQITVTVPNLNLDTFNYYISAYDVDQIHCVELAAIRQKWIDQGQSLNIFVKLENSSGKYLNSIYTHAWELGLKSTYYLRSQSPEVDENVTNSQFECTSCQ